MESGPRQACCCPPVIVDERDLATVVEQRKDGVAGYDIWLGGTACPAGQSEAQHDREGV